LRRDDPSLATRGEACFALRAEERRAPHPVKVVVSHSGLLPMDRAFFRTGDGERIVLTDSADTAGVSRQLGGIATVERFAGDWMSALRELAARRGLKDILIEGGAQIVRGALRSPQLNHWRLAIAPVLLGASGHANIFDPQQTLTDVVRRLNVESMQQHGDTVVL